MYLSRLLLNPRSRQAHRDLADCHQLHRTVLAAFPQAPAGVSDARAHFGVLYRVETRRNGPLALLVQSRVAPDWAHLPTDYLWDTGREPANPACKPVDRYYAALEAGQRLIFRLRANPTRRVRDAAYTPGGPHRLGQRVELVGEEAQLAWLARKAAVGGFRLLQARTAPEVVNARVRPEPKVLGRQPLAAGGGGPAARQLTFGAVVFEGLLEVVDDETFRRTLTTGIGSAKAYGFGLLSVAPARG